MSEKTADADAAGKPQTGEQKGTGVTTQESLGKVTKDPEATAEGNSDKPPLPANVTTDQAGSGKISAERWHKELEGVSKQKETSAIEKESDIQKTGPLAVERERNKPTGEEKPEGQAPDGTPKTESPTRQKPAVPWQYKPVPEGPDKHEEYDARTGNSPEGCAIVGARVRGKKHKHEGTNCDDWFEFSVAGPWTILAVSDGGGSYKFSRVGAKVSCQKVVEKLTASLAGSEVAKLEQLTKEASNEDLEKVSIMYREVVGNAIKGAMRDALQAVLKRIEELNVGFEYHREKNGADLKPLALRDFYATLLVAVHAPLRVGEKTYSFVMGCGCGDGMIGVIRNSITSENACTLLMKPDSGEFSGEVDFLNEKALEEEAMNGRLYPGLFGEMNALVLMTDGVADDYFPNNPGIVSVYADLVLNRIVPPPETCSEENLVSDLKDTKVKSVDEFRQLKANLPVYRILPEGPKQVEVASARLLAEQLGLEKERLATNYGLLTAASQLLADPMPEIGKPEDRLVQWLDAYTMRGSFDDRTLLIMTPKPK